MLNVLICCCFNDFLGSNSHMPFCWIDVQLASSTTTALIALHPQPALALRKRPACPPRQDSAPRPGDVGHHPSSLTRWPTCQTVVLSNFQGASSAKICWASSWSISSRSSTSTTAMGHEPWEIAVFLWCLESWRQLFWGSLCWNPAG